jgi:hypothetical protein
MRAMIVAAVLLAAAGCGAPPPPDDPSARAPAPPVDRPARAETPRERPAQDARREEEAARLREMARVAAEQVLEAPTPPAILPPVELDRAAATGRPERSVVAGGDCRRAGCPAGERCLRENTAYGHAGTCVPPGTRGHGYGGLGAEPPPASDPETLERRGTGWQVERGR